LEISPQPKKINTAENAQRGTASWETITDKRWSRSEERGRRDKEKVIARGVNSPEGKDGG